MDVECRAVETTPYCMSIILIVDDEPEIRESISDLLHVEGYLVLTASNGREALEKLSDPDRPPSLVLLDLMMPVMSGVEFLERVATDESVKHKPAIIVLSAYLTQAKLPEGCGVPPHLRIEKPFQTET